MDETLFIKPSGALRPTIGGGYVFIPAPLPPASLNWAALMNDVGEALQALEELKGAARRLLNATLLIQPHAKAGSHLNPTAFTISSPSGS